MSRQIICRPCSSTTKVLDPEDRKRGWTGRAVYLSVKAPVDHGMRVNGKLIPMEKIRCDICGQDIGDGTIAVAITRNPPGREIADWEEAFGTVLPAHTVAAVDTLTKAEP